MPPSLQCALPGLTQQEEPLGLRDSQHSPGSCVTLASVWRGQDAVEHRERERV